MAGKSKNSKAKNGVKKEEDNPVFTCVGQAVRDISFECPVPAYEAGEMAQDMDLNISVSVAPNQNVEDGWNVNLALQAQMKGALNKTDITLFLAELAYTGTFIVKNMDESQRSGLLHVEGASLLYPFARNILMQLIAEGGYRPPVLSPVNFLALYQQGLQRAQEPESVKDSK